MSGTNIPLNPNIPSNIQPYGNLTQTLTQIPINSGIESGPNQNKGSKSVSIILIILIFLSIVIVAGVFYTMYLRHQIQYVSASGQSVGLNRFSVPLFDQTDVDLVKQFVPEETLDNIAREISNKNYISDPNSPIQKDILLASSDNNYGTDLPWDSDVRSCDVLKNTDQDLYADVQDSKYVTIY